MANKDQIEQWLREGTITQEQANKMLADVTEYKKEQSSSKLIVAISTIGSILLGLGAILFVASNWEAMSNILKMLILVGATIGAYWAGYFFKHRKQNLPKVGASLMFLGALLFGATIFLTAQMYHIDANSHVLILIWLAGVLPFVYVFVSAPIAILSASLFYIWIGLFIFRDTAIWNTAGDFFFLPVLYLVSGVLLFGTGALHYLSDRLKRIARIYRLAGLEVVLLSLFLLTFRFFAGHYGRFNVRDEVAASGQFTFLLITFAIIAIILAVISLLLNLTKNKISSLENGIGIGLVALSLIFFFFPATTNVYVLIFNFILVAIVLTILYVGYNRQDMKIVNTGMFWMSALIIVRYFDFFWDLFPRSIVFMIGGLILVLGGVLLERKRRELKARFDAPTATR